MDWIFREWIVKFNFILLNATPIYLVWFSCVNALFDDYDRTNDKVKLENVKEMLFNCTRRQLPARQQLLWASLSRNAQIEGNEHNNNSHQWQHCWITWWLWFCLPICLQYVVFIKALNVVAPYAKEGAWLCQQGSIRTMIKYWRTKTLTSRIATHLRYSITNNNATFSEFLSMSDSLLIPLGCWDERDGSSLLLSCTPTPNHDWVGTIRPMPSAKTSPVDVIEFSSQHA